MSKIAATLLLTVMATNAIAATEAERTARYEANMAAAQSAARSNIKPSPFTGVPVAGLLQGGTLAYSIANSQTNNPYAIASQIGAASSMIPLFSGKTLSEIINR